jgi:hypothetical protein
MGEALDHERSTFLEVARGWVASYPSTSHALLALGVGLDLMRDAAAVDTMQSALRLAGAEDDREELAAVAILMGVKHGLAGDIGVLRDAVARADSLLRARPPGQERHSGTMAAIASLVGRPETAIAYNSRAPNQSTIPVQIQTTGFRVLMYAAVGMYPDSVSVLIMDLDRQIHSIRDEGLRNAAYEAWLVRPAILGFSRFSPGIVPNHISSAFYLRSAQLSFARKEWRQAIAQIDSADATRRGVFPLSPDALVAESGLMLAVGDTAKAANLLDDVLLHVRDVSIDDLRDPVLSAALGQAVLLRIQIASHTRDPATARRWSIALTTLWHHGSGALRAQVERCCS